MLDTGFWIVGNRVPLRIAEQGRAAYLGVTGNCPLQKPRGMNIKTGIVCFATMKLFTQPLSGADSPSAATENIAASAINRLGLELLAQGTKPEANAVLS